MRHFFGFIASFLFHCALVAVALFWATGTPVRVNMDRPVYTVDLVSLAPPPPPAPVEKVPAASEVKSVSQPESAAPVEVKAEPEPVKPVVKPEPEKKAKKISPKKDEKKKVVKRKEKPKPEPKPKPKPKPKPVTEKQLLAEGLKAAQKKVAAQERRQKRKLADELAALRKNESGVYAHGGRQDGREGGVQGGSGTSGSGLSEVYALIVGTAIKKNWRYPSFAGEANIVASVEIVLASDGRILEYKVVAPSGNAVFDNSALQAIKQTEYVERPRTERDRVLVINFNSQELSE